jgi:hypothetical protein
VAALAQMWEESLSARLAMSPGLPVAVLDALLKTRQQGAVLETESKIFSKIFSREPRKRDQGWPPCDDTSSDLVIHGRGGRI